MHNGFLMLMLLLHKQKNNLCFWSSLSSHEEVRVAQIDGGVVDIYRSGIRIQVAYHTNGSINMNTLDGFDVSFSAVM
jgi:hypothetical protein